MHRLRLLSPSIISFLCIFVGFSISVQSSRAQGSSSVASGSKEWTWMSGANALDQAGTYGSKGVAAPDNVPGARQSAVGGFDPSGNFWLFGGVGNAGDVNDLWKYSPATGEWTWVSGSNGAYQPGRYGTKGKAARGNVPGARASAANWIDGSGNFWLFGGLRNGTGDFNDLWKYSPATGEWTWMSGSNVPNEEGTYGTKGTAAPENVPGARRLAVSATDASGNFWLFGGAGEDSTGAYGDFNDLWKYSPKTGEWTWISGADVVDQVGTYGTKGTTAPGNVPGARESAVSWIDASGNFWLFGGFGNALIGDNYTLNDLWEYGAATGEWTWMSGANVDAQRGTYGIKGTAAPGNVPGARSDAAGGADASGNFWIFGGYGYASEGYPGYLNDLWKYSPKTGEWTWVSGAHWRRQPGYYGTKGTPAGGRVPGARCDAVSGFDASGNFWLFGGYGIATNQSRGSLNDLWRYQP